MKKNSKVMNVLMSLFLVMGMVFGNSVVMAENPTITWDGIGNEIVFTNPSDIDVTKLSIVMVDLMKADHSEELIRDSIEKVLSNDKKSVTIPWKTSENGDNLSKFFSGSFDAKNIEFIATIEGTEVARKKISTPQAPVQSVNWDFTTSKAIEIMVSSENTQYLNKVNLIQFQCGENDYINVAISTGESGNSSISDDGQKLTIPSTVFAPALDNKSVNSIIVNAEGYMNYSVKKNSGDEDFIEIYWDGKDELGGYCDIEIENNGGTADQWTAFKNSLNGAQLDFSDGPTSTVKHGLIASEIDEVESGNKILIHSNTFTYLLSESTEIDISKVFAEIYIGTGQDAICYHSQKHSGGGGGGGETPQPITGAQLSATADNDGNITVTTTSDVFSFDSSFLANYFLVRTTTSSTGPYGTKSSLSSSVISGDSKTLTINKDSLGYVSAGTYKLYFVQYKPNSGTIISWYPIDGNVVLPEANLIDNPKNTVQTVGSPNNKLLKIHLDNVSVSEHDRFSFHFFNDRGMTFDSSRFPYNSVTTEGDYLFNYSAVVNSLGTQVIGEYGIVLIGNNKGYKLYGKVTIIPDSVSSFGSLSPIDDTNQTFLVSKYETTQDSYPTQGNMYLFVLDDNGQDKYVTFYIGLQPNSDDPTTKLMGVNYTGFPDEAIGTVKAIYFVHGHNDTQAEPTTYKLDLKDKNGNSVNSLVFAPKTSHTTLSGSCIIQPGSNLDENFKLIMKCVDDYGQDVTSGFPDSSTYFFLPNQTDQQEKIQFFTGHKKNDTIEFYKTDIDGSSDYIIPGLYKNPRFSVHYTDGPMHVEYFNGVVKYPDTDDVDIGNITKFPGTISITNSTDGKGIVIESTNSDFLKDYYDHEGPSEDHIYSQMQLYSKSGQSEGKGFVSLSATWTPGTEPYPHNTKLIYDPNDPNKVTGLFISFDHLKNIGVTKGDECRVVINNIGYGNVTGFVTPADGASDINHKTNFGINAFQSTDSPDNDYIYFVASALTNEEAVQYFSSIANMTFSTLTGSTVKIIYPNPVTGEMTGDANAQVIPANGKAPTRLKLKADAAVGIPEKWALVNITSNTYLRQNTYCLLHKCSISQPSDLTTTVHTDGVHIYSEDNEYLKKINNVKMLINRVGDATENDFELKDIISAKGTVSQDELVIPLTLQDFETIGQGGRSIDVTKDFWSYSFAEGYVSWWNHTSLSLNPIRFANGMNIAASVDKPSNLQQLDQLAVDLENGYVVTAPELEDKSNYGVEIDGAVAGAISTNNKDKTPDYEDINNCSGQVTVTRTVDSITDSVADDIVKNSDLANIEKKDVQFSVEIRKDTEEIVQLPMNAQVKFRLADGFTEDAGETLWLVSKHVDSNGNVTYPRYSVEVVEIDNVKYGVAFVDQYSDFVLVTSAGVAPAPTPAPSKKEASSGSSIPKKDNVVTCQMAGYPANYAWNESVKACQPGYLDNNGVFHLTTGNTNKRVGVVNTSDKGIGGTITALISSTIAAIAAAYALKKWN